MVPSIKNIYRELQESVGCELPANMGEICIALFAFNHRILIHVSFWGYTLHPNIFVLKIYISYKMLTKTLNFIFKYLPERKNH